jgi:hypothetical protein
MGEDTREYICVSSTMDKDMIRSNAVNKRYEETIMNLRFQYIKSIHFLYVSKELIA